jgi:hypothetical protein
MQEMMKQMTAGGGMPDMSQLASMFGGGMPDMSQMASMMQQMGMGGMAPPPAGPSGAARGKPRRK